MTTHTFLDWRDVSKSLWRWNNFSPSEIACRGTGKLVIHEGAMDRLQELRTRIGKPMIVTSGYRSPEHNRKVGGATASLHLQGIAFDISMANHQPTTFERMAREAGFTGFGFYPRSNFTHIDIGPARQWGTRFPASTPEFSPEVDPRKEVVAEIRAALEKFESGF